MVDFDIQTLMGWKGNTSAASGQCMAESQYLCGFWQGGLLNLNVVL
jgi:hypothetical protein